MNPRIAPPLTALVTALGAVLALALFAAPAGAAISTLDVNYDLDATPEVKNRLDVHRPDGSQAADSRPVVVYVHGGGWRIGDKKNKIANKVELFTGLGYVFVSANYRLSPNPIDPSYPADRVRFPDHPDDVGEALGWIDRNIAGFGGDPSRILLIGHSAGAHLVSLVSTDPSYIDAYGIEPWQLIGTVPLDSDAYDVGDRIAEFGPSGSDIYYNAFGTPEENAADGSWVAASPQGWADEGDPDHLIVTQAGSPQRIEDSRGMASALGQDPDSSVFEAPYDHEGINAAVGSPTDASGETTAIVDFIARMVEGARSPKAKIVGHPSRKLRAREGRTRVRFAFRSSVAGSSFSCRLESKRFRRCSSPKTYRLSPGRYRFRVRAIAPGGRPGNLRDFRFRVLQAR